MSGAEKEQIRIIIQGLDNKIEDVVRDLSIECLANLRETTPVDTGWARANWAASFGEPVDIRHGAVDRQSVSLYANMFDLMSMQSILEWKKKNGPIYIVNNVPYIEILNNGSSTQAPAGFVQTEIEMAIKDIKRRYK